MNDRQAGKQLLFLARNALHLFVEREEKILPDPNSVPRALSRAASTFVTLRHGDLLRGCIGSTDARLPLCQDIVRNTIAAARDPRFDPVIAAELPAIHIEISVLSPFQRLRYVNCDDLLQRLRPGVDGVIISWKEQRGLLLPQVWERLPQPQLFIQALCHKARIPWDAFDAAPPQVQVATFEVVCFSDPDDAVAGERATPPPADRP